VVLTERYQLDPELAVAVVAGGTIGLLLTLPLWLWLTGVI
jgi:malate permease and related proteins